jgi:hypothetical protein
MKLTNQRRRKRAQEGRRKLKEYFEELKRAEVFANKKFTVPGRFWTAPRPNLEAMTPEELAALPPIPGEFKTDRTYQPLTLIPSRRKQKYEHRTSTNRITSCNRLRV